MWVYTNQTYIFYINKEGDRVTESKLLSTPLITIPIRKPSILSSGYIQSWISANLRADLEIWTC